MVGVGWGGGCLATAEVGGEDVALVLGTEAMSYGYGAARPLDGLRCQPFGLGGEADGACLGEAAHEGSVDASLYG